MMRRDKRKEPPSTSGPDTSQASGRDTAREPFASSSREVDGGRTPSIANQAAIVEITQITRNGFFVHIAETEIALMAGKCVSCGGEMKVFTADEIIEIKNDLGLAADDPYEEWCEACNREAGIPTGEPRPKCEVIPFPGGSSIREGGAS